MTKIELVPAEEMSDKEFSVEEDIKEKYKFVIEYFQKSNPNPTTELKFRSPYELLVATILSAQTTDKRVNSITPQLFEKYPTVEEMAKASPDDIFHYVGSITYPGNKSDYLSRMAKIIVKNYNGKIPEDEKELQKLPGVGRKTANVIIATLYNKPVIAVDTHVTRVTERIGLVIDAKNPLDIEEQLLRYTPKEYIHKMSHWLILHGRYICTAKDPQCSICGVRTVCNYYDMYVKK